MGNTIVKKKQQLYNALKKKLNKDDIDNKCQCSQGYYQWDEVNDFIGSGENSNVYKAVRINTHDNNNNVINDKCNNNTSNDDIVAIKRIPPEVITKDILERVQQEARILMEINELNKNEEKDQFLKFKEGYLDEDGGICLVSEFINGNELLELTEQFPRGVPETIAKYYIKQILEAMKKLHDNDIAHLDIKLENIMVDGERDEIKIIDFGFSSKTSFYDSNTNSLKQKKLNEFRGSPHYVSPELIMHLPYDGKKADIWAIGILTYALLRSKFPFNGKTCNDVFTSILENHAYLPHSFFSYYARDFIESLLTRDPSRRPSIDTLLQHPWFLS